MIKKTIPTFMCAVAIALTSQGLVSAQAATAKFSPTESKKMVEIDFAGGTIAEYVNLVRAKSEQKFLNVIVALEAQDYMLPSIKIRTNPTDAVEILSSFSSQRGEVFTESRGENTTIIKVEGEPLEVTVIAVGSLLGRNNLDQNTLLAAIEIGLEMQGSGKNVSLKLHKETGLLFARGPKSATRIVNEVIDQLHQSAGPSNVFGKGSAGDDSTSPENQAR